MRLFSSVLLAPVLSKLAGATPAWHHIRQDVDPDDPKEWEPSEPPSSLTPPERPDSNPFASGIPAAPSECDGGWKPSEECARALSEMLESDDGLIAFGGGNMIYDDNSCSDDQREKLSVAAWDALTLSRFGAKVPSDGRQVAAWRTWIGPDFVIMQDRITANLNRVADFNINKKFDIYFHCKDVRNSCSKGRNGKGVGGYAYEYRNWGGLGVMTYHIVLCDVYFTLDNLESKQELIEEQLAKGETKYASEAEWQKNTGQYLLHEMMHLNTVGQPHIRDEKVANNDDNEVIAYGPYQVYKLATRDINKGGGAGRASTNADSYAWLTNSLYFQELTGYFPRPPRWRQADEPVMSGEAARAASPLFLHLGVVEEDTTEDEFEALFDQHLEVILQSPEPDIIPTNPDDLPEPDCASGGTSFAAADVEQHLYDFCSDDSMWGTNVVPYISTGNRETKDGWPKSSGVSRGFDMPGSDDKLWAGIMFSRESCQGLFTIGIGESAQEKQDYCWERFRAVLHGCQTDTTTEKMGGELKEACAVYGLKMAKDNPFDEPRWYSDLGEMQCKEDSEDEESDVCICWYSGYPDHKDSFKRPNSGQCNGGEVEMKDMIEE